MTHPQSKFIDRITFNNLHYLTDTLKKDIYSADFNLTTGKPLNNLYSNPTVDPFFLNIVEKSLGETVNVKKNFIYNYPEVLEIDSMRDIEVSNETNIDAVFITEGASMQNMVGYYMYIIDEQGNKKILDDEFDDSTQTYHYKPTIIFPHVLSEKNNANTLSRGDARNLRGNLPNGNFQNIHVGFFLICHGWYSFNTSKSVPHYNILYSTIDFCTKYKDTDFDMINEKIYSVYVKGESQDGVKMLFISFEDDVVNNLGDCDYNDCVLGLYISDVNNIVDYDKYAELRLEEPAGNSNNIVKYSDEGEYLDLDEDVYNIPLDKEYLFERHQIFDNQQDRDDCFDAINNMLTNYNNGREKVNVNGQYKLITKFRFRKNDINGSKKGKSKILKLQEMKFNNGNSSKKTSAIAYANIISKILNNQNYTERYRFYDSGTLQEYISLSNASIDKPSKDTNSSFRILGNGLMDCVNGSSHLPFKDVANYMIYKNVNSSNGLVINVKMDNHPTGYMLGKKTFLRYISFVVDSSEHVIIDLGDLGLYRQVNGNLQTLNTSLQKIQISEIRSGDATIKNLVSIFRNNSGATFRTVKIKDTLLFYCIKFTNIKNNPSMVYLDTSNLLNWSNSFSTISGTYYNKQTFYPVNSLI